MESRYCMVRSKSAGVFAGNVEKLDGQTALLRNARRIWYWEGAASLSQLAAAGAAAARDMRAALAELNAGNACTEEDE